MLTDLINFEERTTLIMRSGIQLLDFGVSMQPRKEASGQFITAESSKTLVRLMHDEHNDRYIRPGGKGNAITPRFEVSMEETLSLLDGVWLPLPYLRTQDGNTFYEGPTTWARAQIIGVEGQDDQLHTTHRAVVAFDTNVFDTMEGTQYLAPTVADVDSGEVFALPGATTNVGWFLELPWVDSWLREVFEERAADRLGLLPEDIEKQLATYMYHGHYLNVLSVLQEKFSVPEVRILHNRVQPETGAGYGMASAIKPIDVDLVLDIGNSRTCGVIIENHPQSSEDLMNRYEMVLRDLSRPHYCYTKPFESRLEFAQAIFGKDHLACDSGRGDAFQWPTMARVGPEATRLASKRRGTEGATGLSSPKRYLWDTERYEPGWKFSVAYNQNDIEPDATCAPFANLINEVGEPLFRLAPEEQIPVFVSHYSRSSIMTFMLAEILTQVLTQINSPAQRLRQSHANQARRLHSVTLTVPPSMPKPERVIFKRCMEDAVGLVWKALNWHPEDEPIDGEGEALATPAFPEIRADWDEATCGQVVYLFSEAHNKFGGSLGEFFSTMRQKMKEPKASDERKLTIASIDIGGGTTDLVVTDYVLDAGTDVNTYVRPVQRFRDGFKVAGDDIMLEVIRHMVMLPLRRAFKERGLENPEPFLSSLMGAEPGTIQEKVIRQKITLQVLYPLALEILKAYENYDPCSPLETETKTIGQLLETAGAPSQEVLAYIEQKLRQQLGDTSVSFDLLEVALTIDLDRLHNLFLTDEMEIGKTLRSLCEVAYCYNPDVLLLTGRPSRLPGIVQLVRAFLPIAPDRIIPMNQYRCGTWYPFHQQGRIDDPKTTAVVGAALCVLGKGRINRFFFRSNELKPYSTVRYIGLMDSSNVIKQDDVFYENVDLDNDDYELPDEVSFQMRGKTILGFRQLPTERWGASPLYELDIDKKVLQKLYGVNDGAPPILNVKLKKVPRSPEQRFAIASVTSDQLAGIGASSVSIKLNTLNLFGLSGDSYWLDTGSVIA